MHGLLLEEAGAEIYGRVLLGARPRARRSSKLRAMDADLAALPPVPAADYIAAVAQHVVFGLRHHHALRGRALRADGDRRRLGQRGAGAVARLRQQIRADAHEKILQFRAVLRQRADRAQDKHRDGVRRHGRGRRRPLRGRRVDDAGDRRACPRSARRRRSIAVLPRSPTNPRIRCCSATSRDPPPRRRGHAALRRAPLPPVAQNFHRLRAATTNICSYLSAADDEAQRQELQAGARPQARPRARAARTA